MQDSTEHFVDAESVARSAKMDRDNLVLRHLAIQELGVRLP